MITDYFVQQTKKNISETICSPPGVKYSFYLAFMSKEVSSIEHKIRTVLPYIIFFIQTVNYM